MKKQFVKLACGIYKIAIKAYQKNILYNIKQWIILMKQNYIV